MQEAGLDFFDQESVEELLPLADGGLLIAQGLGSLDAADELLELGLDLGVVQARVFDGFEVELAQRETLADGRGLLGGRAGLDEVGRDGRVGAVLGQSIRVELGAQVQVAVVFVEFGVLVEDFGQVGFGGRAVHIRHRRRNHLVTREVRHSVRRRRVRVGRARFALQIPEMGDFGRRDLGLGVFELGRDSLVQIQFRVGFVRLRDFRDFLGQNFEFEKM